MGGSNAARLAATAGTVAAAALALGAAPAAAGAASRASYDERFTTRAAGAPTGWWFRIRHRDPSNPGGKPPAVVSNRLELPAGTRFDHDVLVKCRATDEELTARGRAACPRGSYLGEGTAKVITGLGAPFDPFPVEVYFHNGNREIVTVAQRGGRTLAVERSRISGSTVISAGPPPPGPPPDGHSSIGEVIWKIPPHGRWLVTPPRCPASRRWVTRATFRYEDGGSAIDTAVHPCTPGKRRASPPARRRSAHVSVRRVRGERGCVRRRLRVLVNASPRRARVRLRIDGRHVRTLPRRRMRVRVSVARLRPGRHVLTARATSPGRRPATARLRFVRCS